MTATDRIRGSTILTVGRLAGVCLITLAGCQALSKSEPAPAVTRPVPLAASAPAILGEAVMEKAVLERVNQFRQQHQLPPLEPKADLTAIARRQSYDMICLGHLSHAGSDGAGLESRAHRAGVHYQQMGENVASNRGHTDPVASAVDGWLSSPPQRQNILLPNMRQTGVGVVQDGATGTYYFTQVFCKRMPPQTRPQPPEPRRDVWE